MGLTTVPYMLSWRRRGLRRCPNGAHHPSSLNRALSEQFHRAPSCTPPSPKSPLKPEGGGMVGMRMSWIHFSSQLTVSQGSSRQLMDTLEHPGEALVPSGLVKLVD